MDNANFISRVKIGIGIQIIAIIAVLLRKHQNDGRSFPFKWK